MATDLDAYIFYDGGAGATVTEGASAGFTRGWRDAFRTAIRTGVCPLELNEFKTTGDSTGMQVKTATGRVWIEGNWGESSGVKTTAVASAHATLDRIDLVVLRNDYSGNKIVVDILTGTASGSPVAPTPTQNTTMYELPLAKVSVLHTVTTINAGDVTDARAFTREMAPSCKATRTAGFAIASGAGYTAITLNGTPGWVAGMTISGTQVIVPQAGRYRCFGLVNFPANATGIRRAGIMQNGTITDTANSGPGDSSVGSPINCAGEFDAAASDFFQIGGMQDSGGSLSPTAWLIVEYIGPSANRP